VFCLLGVLVKLSVLAKWLTRKTPLRKPNCGKSHKADISVQRGVSVCRLWSLVRRLQRLSLRTTMTAFYSAASSLPLNVTSCWISSIIVLSLFYLVYTVHYLTLVQWSSLVYQTIGKVKVKVHTLDITPLHSESPLQKRSGMARVLKGSQFYLHTHVVIGNRNEPYLPFSCQL